MAKREILGIMNKCIAKPRETRKESGPVVGEFCVLNINLCLKHFEGRRTRLVQVEHVQFSTSAYELA